MEDYTNQNKALNTARIFGVFIFIYLAISPFYLLPSGTPQISDYFMALVMTCTIPFIFLSKVRTISFPIAAGLLFVLSTIVINLVHYAFDPDIRFIFAAVYYVYNFSVFLFTLYLFKTYPQIMLKFAYAGVCVAIMFVFSYTEFFSDRGVSVAGTFNNKNQLAYWSLLALLFLWVMKRGSQFTVLDYVLIGVLAFLETVALSKAGLLTFAFAIMMIVFTPQVSKNAKLFLSLIFSLLVIFVLFSLPTLINKMDNIEALERVVTRIEDIGQDEDDSAIGRNYDRLWLYPEYVLFGAGEGGYARFSPENPKELHSGFATILFAYGILPFAFMSLFMLSVIHRQPWYYTVILACPFIYGLTHQHLRFTHFWILLGIMEASRYYSKDMVMQSLPKMPAGFWKPKVGQT